VKIATFSSLICLLKMRENGDDLWDIGGVLEKIAKK